MHLEPSGYLCAIEGWWTTETAEKVFNAAGNVSLPIYYTVVVTDSVDTDGV